MEKIFSFYFFIFFFLPQRINQVLIWFYCNRNIPWCVWGHSLVTVSQCKYSLHQKELSSALGRGKRISLTFDFAFYCLLHLHLLQFHPLESVEKIHVFNLKSLLTFWNLKSCFHLYQTKKLRFSYKVYQLSPLWSGAYETFHRSRLSNVIGGLALLSDLVECLPLESQASFKILTCEILDLVLICSCLWYTSYIGGAEKQIVKSENDLKSNTVFFSLLENFLFFPSLGESYRWSSIWEHALFKT